MILPAWLRERIHEWVTPGGCWISSSLIEKFGTDGPMMRDGKISVTGAAAMCLTAFAADRGADTMTVDLEGQESKGVPIGDWRITVERLPTAER